NESPTLSVLTAPRQVGVAQIEVTALDAESDDVTVRAELSREGGAFETITLDDAKVHSRPGGLTSTLTWDAAAALGPRVHERLILRLPPDDGTTSGAAILTPEFMVGNEQQELTSVRL